MRNFDVFGKEVLLRYQGQTHKQTTIGGLLTIGILVVVALRLSYLLNQISNQKSPQVYQYERQALQSQSFFITPSNFTFVVGITSDGQNYQLINTQIFNIKAFVTIQTTKSSANSQIPQKDTQQYQLSLQQCTSSDFKISNAELESSKYSNQYCLSPNQQVQISGDYTGNEFATLTIQLIKCTGANCADEATIQSFIKNYFVEVYISDILVQPSVGSNPYSYYGRLFRINNLYTQTKIANINFRNNQIETDKGFFFSSISSESNPSFSYYDEQVYDYTSNYVTSVVLKYEQKKENYYSLSYQNFLGVVCEIGALIYVLSLIISPICSFCAKADIFINLINDYFCFQEVKAQVKTSKDQDKTTNGTHNVNQNHQNLAELVSEEKESYNKMPIQSVFANISKKESLRINSYNENKVKSILKQKDTQNHYSHPSADSMQSSSDKIEELKQLLEQIREYNQAKEQLEKKKPLIKGQKEQKQKMMDNIKAKQLRDNIKKTQIKITEVLKKKNNSFTCNFKEYIKSYFLTNPNSKIIDETCKQLNQNLDIQTIMNKIGEIEYLKKILLNEDQQALFKFLPKTHLNYSIIQNDIIFHDPSSGEKILPEYYQEEYEKLKRGINSYKNIMSQDQLQMADSNILKIIDPNYISLFKDLCDRKKSVTITQTEQIRNTPSIQIHKVSSQQYLVNPQKKTNKKLLNSPQFSPQQEPAQQIVIYEQQKQVVCLQDNMLTRQLESIKSQRNSLNTPQNTTAQLVLANQIDNDFSSDFIQQHIEQESTSNHNYLHSILEENVKYHSNSGIIQKPYTNNEPDVTLKNNK